ncbi:hypothetical protein PILCRDRAFT_135344 [Piloderma croceum F 1598]|uniref:Uncharacterized protein n=1 Tax=Piloderma croceum (strain F 1598) TaxID=765440 RepID=A0A0C3GJ21_PILCF|nr:hypothetical protein PILCRDRAFT_135344 [Piloderma croceum F 1598]
MLSSTICDAKCISDGMDVSLKSITPSVHPYEADWQLPLQNEVRVSCVCLGLNCLVFQRSDLRSRNHCVPILEVLKVPDRDDVALLVTPLLNVENVQ